MWCRFYTIKWTLLAEIHIYLNKIRKIIFGVFEVSEYSSNSNSLLRITYCASYYAQKKIKEQWARDIPHIKHKHIIDIA